ncbi:hypothetical protein CAOG_02891 [Capsaspora owczarzaki ATCC 30864]|uniref:S1 motif domain-containing protein n=1 Tax=Capsaspora owczarzaki (strain ATCC 30864) TaxID=595528 RepID=A0A0D2WN84_CAPO3|nr:hypothetical protein CAOG_02891 [Capsaspora owczarzaki ATCC 30864]KJE91808.1 hypothetical protein CAOG_002891 [Capsaspora owczarzaki ATCC 30864]|eukprot:XP_004363730.1 hypothetical protein CAOG_02891 [Capsaspora owczarzaki ATCC 30864]
MAQVEIVTPGTRLGTTQDFLPGAGTYVRPDDLNAIGGRGSTIVAALAGFRIVQQPTTTAHAAASASTAAASHAMEIDDDNDAAGAASARQVLPSIHVVRDLHDANPIPAIGNVVTATVTSITSRFAKVNILCVGSSPLREPFHGMIRIQDVRETEKDKVEMYKSFRPGDIVRAEVISLGDSRSYFLATSKNDLGVVFAESAAGASMLPVSWCEMQCPKTKAKEFRKVAKTF